MRIPGLAWMVSFSVRTLMPRTEELPGAEDAGIDAFVPRLLSECSWFFWLGVVGGAVVFMLGPPLTVYLPVPAFLLSARLRELHAQRLSAHPVYLVRQSSFALKMVGGLCWAADPAVRARIGCDPYPPDPGTWRKA